MSGHRRRRFTLNFSDQPLSIQEVLDANFLNFESSKRENQFLLKYPDIFSGIYLCYLANSLQVLNCISINYQYIFS